MCLFNFVKEKSSGLLVYRVRDVPPSPEHCLAPLRQKKGTILVDGREVAINKPTDAMRNGIGYVPEDRKMLGLFDDLDVKHNIGIAGVNRFTRWGFMLRDKLRELTNEMKQRLSIKMTDVNAPITSLSGGNQQKVLISRWLAMRPHVLIMNEPDSGGGCWVQRRNL